MSDYEAKIIEQAELDLEDAFEFYEFEIEGLGKKFLLEFRKAINRIYYHPKAWPKIENNRKCRLQKFPHSIIYALEENTIIILAVAHQHRKPEYWIERIRKK